MSNGVHYIKRNPVKGGWDLRREGASRATLHYSLKSQAIFDARELCRRQGTELWIYDVRGKLVEVEHPSESAR